MKIRACIFDLDGVIVDTARYHFLAWKRLADELNIGFTETDNERLKGVSRNDSLKILLELGGIHQGNKDMEYLAAKKNSWYVEYIMKLQPNEILPGVLPFLAQLSDQRIKKAIGSASKNTSLILERLNLKKEFDAIVDGTLVDKAKPNPEVFLTAARMLKVIPAACIVFEDARAGIEAANHAGMVSIGVGKKENLEGAHLHIEGFKDLQFKSLLSKIKFR